MRKLLKKWLEIPEPYDDRPIREVVAAKLHKLDEKTQGLDVNEAIRENSLLELICGSISAIEKHLEIRSEWHWENDPNYLPPECPKIRVWKVKKLPRNKRPVSEGDKLSAN